MKTPIMMEVETLIQMQQEQRKLEEQNQQLQIDYDVLERSFLLVLKSFVTDAECDGILDFVRSKLNAHDPKDIEVLTMVSSNLNA